MKLSLCIVACLVVAFPAVAQSQAPYAVAMFGIGRSSCATWLSPSGDADGRSWILGYWTGMNLYNKKHTVGANSDAQGIFGEIKLICTAEPSTMLADAVGRVYAKFQQSGK